MLKSYFASASRHDHPAIQVSTFLIATPSLVPGLRRHPGVVLSAIRNIEGMAEGATDAAAPPEAVASDVAEESKPAPKQFVKRTAK